MRYRSRGPTLAALILAFVADVNVAFQIQDEALRTQRGIPFEDRVVRLAALKKRFPRGLYSVCPYDFDLWKELSLPKWVGGEPENPLGVCASHVRSTSKYHIDASKKPFVLTLATKRGVLSYHTSEDAAKRARHTVVRKTSGKMEDFLVMPTTEWFKHQRARTK